MSKKKAPKVVRPALSTVQNPLFRMESEIKDRWGEVCWHTDGSISFSVKGKQKYTARCVWEPQRQVCSVATIALTCPAHKSLLDDSILRLLKNIVTVVNEIDHESSRAGGMFVVVTVEGRRYPSYAVELIFGGALAGPDVLGWVDHCIQVLDEFFPVLVEGFCNGRTLSCDEVRLFMVPTRPVLN